MKFNLARKLPPGYAAVPLGFKLVMLFGALLIAVVFIYYTQDVVSQLKDKTRRDVRLYVKLYQVALSDQTSGVATSLIFEEVISSVSFPIIFADSSMSPQYWKELDGIADGMATDVSPDVVARVKERMNAFAEQGNSVEIVSNNRLFYHMLFGDPKLVKQLQLMPFVEVGVIAVFTLVGFVGFRNIKRSEQRNIWVGMAKETAHQLGTPLSSLLGWLQLLGIKLPDENVSNGELTGKEILSRMETDVHRLERIANRFSLIGSKPTLETIDANDILSDLVEYFCKRLPHQGKGLCVNFERNEPKPVEANRELLSWVIENIVKNAMEACDSKTGVITISSSISKDSKTIYIEIKDNGKGMTSSEMNKVFNPGFTTKKRGWGLGLTLSRRIIMEHHGGKIFVKESEPGKGTTFRIELPSKI